MTSQWMEEHAFTDASFPPILKNTTSPCAPCRTCRKGGAEKGQYEVSILPSIWYSVPEGSCYRIQKTMEPEELLAHLKRYSRPALLRCPGERIQPRPVFALSRPALIPDVHRHWRSPFPSSSVHSPAGYSTLQPLQPKFTIQVEFFFL